MDLSIKIDGESVLLHDNAATIIYALRVLKSADELNRVQFAVQERLARMKDDAGDQTPPSPSVPRVLQGGIGESWRKVWREGFAPAMGTKALEALRDGLKRDDSRITQGSTTTPPPMTCVKDWPIEAGDALTYAGWQGGETDGKVGWAEEYHARLCFDADTRLGEPAACRWFLNWFDSTPRNTMRRELLAEVELALNEQCAAV